MADLRAEYTKQTGAAATVNVRGDGSRGGELPTAGYAAWLEGQVDAARAEAAEAKERLREVQAATAEGCLAAALGQPLHSVAQTRHNPRTLTGDAWEAGWEYVSGSAQWREAEREAAALREAWEAVKNDGLQVHIVSIGHHPGGGQYAWQVLDCHDQIIEPMSYGDPLDAVAAAIRARKAQP